MRYIFIILICFLSATALSQPIQIRSNGVATVEDIRLMAGKNLFIPIYADTNAALSGTNEGIDSSGALIYTRNPYAIWYRRNRQWVQLSNGGSVGDAWLVTGNNPNAGSFIGTTFGSIDLVLRSNGLKMQEMDGLNRIWRAGVLDTTIGGGTSLEIDDTDADTSRLTGLYKFNKLGFEIGGVTYYMPSNQGTGSLYNPGNGFLSWNTPGSGGTIPGIDSFTVSPMPPSLTTSICYWIDGAPVCYPLAGDSLKVLNDTLFQYFNGDSIPYPLVGDRIFFGNTAIINGNIFCSSISGNDTCILINNNGQYADSIGLNADSSLYLLFNNGVQLGSGVSTLQKDLIGVGRILVRDTLTNTIAVYWDSVGYTPNILWQELVQYTADNSPSGNIVATMPTDGGYWGIHVPQDQDETGVYVFTASSPLNKTALLGSYDSVGQTINWGFYAQGDNNFLLGSATRVISSSDTSGFVLDMSFSNTELATDSMLTIDVNGQVKKRGISSGSSQWTTNPSTTSIYYGDSVRIGSSGFPSASLHIDGGAIIGEENNGGSLSSTLGSLALGAATDGIIRSTVDAAFSFGLAQDNSAIIEATAAGTFAGGFVNDGSKIQSSNTANFVWGSGATGPSLIRGGGDAGFTVGFTVTGTPDTIENSANRSFLFGNSAYGTTKNSGDNSFMLGSGFENFDPSCFVVGFGNREFFVDADTISLLKETHIYGNVGINTPSPDSALTVNGGIKGNSAELTSTSTGFLPNRVTTAQMNAITPSDGMMVYNTDEKGMFYYNSDWGWESNSSSYNVKFGCQYINEFLGPSTGNDNNVLITTAGGAISATTASETNRQGIANLSTSTSATARAYISTAAGTTNQTMILGGGKLLFEAAVRVPTLSTSGERFQLLVGLGSINNSVNIVNGVMFLYDEGGVSTGSATSANWQVYTASGSSRTFTTTSTAVTAHQWYKLKAVVNAAATSVTFYIDDVAVKTETSTIPTGALGITINLIKSVGTTARTTDVDYVYFKQKYTTPK